jgi:hypothetical protein
MDKDCQRANCQYVHYNKRLAKVRLVDFKQLINASTQLEAPYLGHVR